LQSSSTPQYDGVCVGTRRILNDDKLCLGHVEPYLVAAYLGFEPSRLNTTQDAKQFNAQSAGNEQVEET